jgi:hypothetical protein
MRRPFNRGVPQSPQLPISIAMRDTLWGDMSMDKWPPPNTDIRFEPWNRFAQARDLLHQGKNDEAIRVLLAITDLPGLESRHYLQAWYFLRQLKVPVPAGRHDQLYAVVVEASMPKGLDLLVVYQDFHARFYSYAGGGTIWERPDTRLDVPIQTLLNAAQEIAKAIGTAEKPRPPVPPQGQMRFSMLTPGGMAFGQGPEQALLQDITGRVIVMAAANLLQEITKLNTSRR